MSKGFLWVVEIDERDGMGWAPTFGVSLSRWGARIEREQWKSDNPEDKFRVRKYVREEAKEK